MTDIAQPLAQGAAIYRGMDQATLDAAYNNSAAVSDSPRWLDDWRQRSALVRERANARLDVPYGSKQRTRFDFFPSGTAKAPLFVFIHGGYWQRNAKELFSFIASGPNARGIDVAIVGYTLAPEARLAEIVLEMRQAIAFLRDSASQFGFNGEQIYVGGWSAGGHLTATSGNEPAVKGAMPISGIFDLEPIALSYLDAPLRLSPADVDVLSPLRTLRSGAAPQCIVVGGGELAELQRQSRIYTERAQSIGLSAKLRTLPGHHHFSILDELSDHNGALVSELLSLISGSAS